MEVVGDVVIVYDLACAHCGSLDAAQLDKRLGLVFCDSACFEANLDEELRTEPLLSDTIQWFWSKADQCHVIAASSSSLKRKAKAKAKRAKDSAKKKAKRAKERAKEKARRAKERAKAKKAARKAQRKVTPAGRGTVVVVRRPPVVVVPGAPVVVEPGAPVVVEPGDLPEDIEPDVEAEVFSLQYLLRKHGFDMHELDAKKLYELKPYIVANKFGTFLLDFAISTLSSEQGYPEISASILPALAQSQLALAPSQRQQTIDWHCYYWRKKAKKLQPKPEPAKARTTPTLQETAAGRTLHEELGNALGTMEAKEAEFTDIVVSLSTLMRAIKRWMKAVGLRAPEVVAIYAMAFALAKTIALLGAEIEKEETHVSSYVAWEEVKDQINALSPAVRKEYRL